MKKVALIFGTRPEAVKMAPVYLALKNSSLRPVVIATAQHREMLDQVLSLFGIEPDFDLNIMQQRQSLSGLTSRLIEKLDEIYLQNKFDATLVQGDTTSTFTGALVSFYHKIPVGHVEAGLRTANVYDPFPEEVNRRLNGVISTYHYPPTEKSKLNLLKEGVPEENMLVTGNTVIDALLWVTSNKSRLTSSFREALGVEGDDYILVTMHRRENWGRPMQEVMKAIKDVLNEFPRMKVVFPVHLNPAVREVVYPELEEHDRVVLTDPLDYLPFISLMEKSKLILTDSGGIQEEAPALGKPTLVLRRTTERPEAIEAGTAKLVGTSREAVFMETMRLLSDSREYERMAKARNPFGDGTASKRISDHLCKNL
ncbi:UDP-N-acetylglucosamine 2-epimerase [Mesotoga sp. Brook.08.YT.4.2.5.1]|uniref:non-hydrolyzing UDP-N-acetylglucosamine 2-epimerase n=1 Tax=unclassified Mesotoga TaxID=1184398 RepID=UPI000C17E609|nr:MULTISPECIES: UDP-N-acetylglucosamine 2-epimerase (non-hydrolyzing) [unclassified Mesotoga]PNE22978.1 UDP-N-acetylglucosamine 2-epimerase [Mesotoga sp. Brook.08.YT.4.2.5.1]PVD15958.1 UDP-N-acetylglucosamine 2-epimerase [Mesotoga sp. Brook.08.105.5.1]RAO97961.1 UDP-N-acetylglucosamine 2-epimerase [Mesotoga sp. Brook.08.YT.4.2.5.4.]RDI93981.1 UDP-N-acetylglucosamine 2-epimerase [Mesotoga sp. Brook.08.YT.4.2.5.2.]